MPLQIAELIAGLEVLTTDDSPVSVIIETLTRIKKTINVVRIFVIPRVNDKEVYTSVVRRNSAGPSDTAKEDITSECDRESTKTSSLD